ncbi:hypothetical protein ACNF49_41250 [Actinomadura sp. ATCC 39365]
MAAEFESEVSPPDGDTLVRAPRSVQAALRASSAPRSVQAALRASSAPRFFADLALRKLVFN